MSPHEDTRKPSGRTEARSLSATLSNPSLAFRSLHLSLSSSAVTNEPAGQGGGKSVLCQHHQLILVGAHLLGKLQMIPEQFFFPYQFPTWALFSTFNHHPLWCPNLPTTSIITGPWQKNTGYFLSTGQSSTEINLTNSSGRKKCSLSPVEPTNCGYDSERGRNVWYINKRWNTQAPRRA
ncbi:hypothetical protein CDAR_464371 [Caerostris darwini]|uniref:Uncharacterized protein n=1 Tax=Caerostris darwini TaxID=1538125 RepID=A0AAV4VV59_9ARAC|nr:hypothetical protein CDAR_464371 [Caerostris darwini]